MSASELASKVETDGFAVVPDVLVETASAPVEAALARLSEASTARRGSQVYGARNLLSESPEIRALTQAAAVRDIIDPIVTSSAFAVRGLFFDKSPAANWAVNWHQDRVISVTEKHESHGFTLWSTKAGIPHVQPPLSIIERMLAVRIHLDDCDDSNGPLQVIPGSHKLGYLESGAIQDLVNRCKPVTCLVPRGGVVLMRPLTLHSSAKANSTRHRRVIHIEFTTDELPPPLRWAFRDLS